MKTTLRAIKNSQLGFKIRKYCFQLFELLSNNSLEKRKFHRKTGYKLNLDNPQSFNEKICWRKFYDKNPLYTRIADKYEVRNVLIEMLGENDAKQILIPLLYVTEEPETIPFDDLPEEYVIKANHGSGTNIIVEKSTDINREAIIQTCKYWLKLPHGYEKHEWAYIDIPRKIIIEELIRDEQGNLPNDYKFHMFDGKCEFIQVNQGLFYDTKQRTVSLVTPNWEKIDVFYQYKSADLIEVPSHHKELNKLAEKLSEIFDYIRVDLYQIKDKTYFGEFTLYPFSGKGNFKPTAFDFEIG